MYGGLGAVAGGIAGRSYRQKSEYSIRINSIWFNESLIKDMNDLEICCTAFHEVRHIYQFVILDFGVKLGNTFDVPASRKKLWQFEINNYLVSREENDIDYLKQDIEIDAIAFSHYLMKELFEVTTVIPETIKDKVLERVNEIQIKYKDKIYEIKLR